MSHDVLASAARALRDETEGDSPGASATRMRIVSSARQKRKREILVLRAGAVLLAAALGSTAWAGATGRLPAFPALERVFGGKAVEGPSESPRGALPAVSNDGSHEQNVLAPAGSTPPPDAVPAVPVNPPVATPPLEEPSSAAPSHPVSAVPDSRPSHSEPSAQALPGKSAPPVSTSKPLSAAAGNKALPSASSDSAVSAGSDKPPASADVGTTAAAADPGQALYTKAHALHFQAHDYAAARAAWEAYLKAAPSGRFAAFAHYNHAICLLRLGRTSEARRALQLFATGAFGGYRKAEAQSLLDAMGP